MKWLMGFGLIVLSGCAVSVADDGVTGTVLFDQNGISGTSVGINL
ncbi:MAG: hypothetical protein AAFN59_04565 [Pseudomonadota bacterium]